MKTKNISRKCTKLIPVLKKQLYNQNAKAKLLPLILNHSNKDLDFLTELAYQ
jgi:hypothetical protein